MPELAKTAGVPLNQVTISVPFFLMGAAIGQFISGPTSDIYGRTVLIKIGLTVFILSTSIDLFSENLLVTKWTRITQAVAAGMLTIQVRTLIADAFENRVAASVISLTSAISATIRALAPVIGITIVSLLGLAALDWFVLIIGAAYLIIIYLIPLEVRLIRNELKSDMFLNSLRLIKKAFRKRETVYYLVIGVLASTSFFTIVSSNVLYLTSFLHVDKSTLTLFLSLISVMVVLACLLNSVLVMRIRQKYILNFFVLVCLLMACTLWFLHQHIDATYQMICLLVIIFSKYIIRINAMTWTIKSCNEARATASSLFHAFSIGSGAVAGFVINQTLNTSTDILFALLTIFSVITLVLILKRPESTIEEDFNLVKQT